MKKKYDDDDGRTVANMNVEGMPWYRSEARIRQEKELSELKMTKNERRAMRRATAITTLKIVCIVGSALVATFLLMWLWIG